MPDPTLTDEATAETPSPRSARVRKAQSTFSQSILSVLSKIVLLGLIDAAAVYSAMVLFGTKQWLALLALIVVTVAINVIYIPSNRFLPAKYLTPGLIFLLVFQVFVLIYTVYVAFTNVSDGHNGSKQDAIAAIQRNNTDRVEGSPVYSVTVLNKDGKLALGYVDPDTNRPRVGDATTPMADKPDAKVEDGKIVSVPGYSTLTLDDQLRRQNEITTLAVQLSDDPTTGFLRTPDGSNGYVYVARYAYNKANDTFTDKQGQVFRDTGQGSYVAADGTRIEPGWVINVGFGNFVRAVTDPTIREPLLRVTLWTFFFAIASVFLSFTLGLALAILLNDQRIKGLKIYRSLLIIPYAFPGFLSALIWSGLLNPSFGFFNTEIFHAQIGWLTDPWLAKFSLLFVNTWLGYPYMFLVCTGALQSIPDDVLEAARVDGATTWQIFRQIKLPLLMVPLAPLLISSFAFNFNNFNLIFMLTRGGPRFNMTGLDVGATDILISMVYKVAMGDRGRDSGLASAFAIIIFVVVGLVSYISFRKTRSLEEIN